MDNKFSAVLPNITASAKYSVKFNMTPVTAAVTKLSICLICVLCCVFSMMGAPAKMNKKQGKKV
jgi:hypothetical protein